MIRDEDTLNEFPTFRSKLVRLRQLRYKDIQTMPRLVTVHVVRYLEHMPYPYGTEDARRFINKSRRNFRLKKELNFAIDLIDSGNLVGVISLQKIDNVNKSGQMGYWIGKKYWNMGLATESINLLINYAFHVLRLHKVYANVLTTNRASIRVLEKNGLKKEGILRDSIYKYDKFFDVVLYYRLNMRSN
ncbi:MAG: GNAT family N-acetyltransferase [Candidatus Nitrosopolaris sp.]